jgi:glycosyltransferase involved in cell wall biosynthesis
MRKNGIKELVDLSGNSYKVPEGKPILLDKKISVVIPCYNQTEYIQEAIDSVLAQTHPAYEIIVVNDGGDVPAIRGVSLVNKENGGLSSARNAGIAVASGDYVCCLDADDKLPPNYFEELCKIDADIAGCGYKTFGDYETEWKTRGNMTLDDLLDGNRTQCAAVFKRDIFKKVKFDTQMKHGLEDHLYWLEAVAQGFTMKCP